MSSNPFRRQQPPKELSVPGSFDDAVNAAALEGPQGRGRKSSTSKKTVRIQTPPPLSPDPVTTGFGDALIRRISNEPRAGSPPPPQLDVDLTAVASKQLDPLSRQFGEEIAPLDPQVVINTRRNSEGGPDPQAALAAKVLNPFQKTMADTESAYGGAGDDTEGVNHTGRDAGKVDVSTFTRMLMAGKGGPVPPAEPSTTTNMEQRAQAPGIPQGFDDLEDASSSASSEDEGTLSKPASNTSKGAPPPPKHRHGKSINERAPQTVSFNDFEGTSDGFSASADQSKKRLPPPPPLSRRPPSTTFEPGQLSSAPQSPGANAGGKLQKPAPPPPPTRRGANRNSMPPDQGITVPDASPPLDETFDTAAARRAANTVPTLSRSSSTSEQRTGAPPPPPPTRRRRGSSNRSMENQPSGNLRNASGDDRRVSQESSRKLGHVDEDENSAAVDSGRPQRDILADLSAFQAEVDALRNSYRK